MNDIQKQIAELPLRDIHLPQAVSWWPPAPGWWMLITGIILIGLLSAWVVYIKRRLRVRRHALAELDRYFANYQNNADCAGFVTRISHLLKRVSLAYFPTETVAGLSGEKWLRFLDRLFAVKGVRKSFLDRGGRLLQTLPYEPQPFATIEEIEQLEQTARAWIKQFPLNRRTYNRILPGAHVAI